MAWVTETLLHAWAWFIFKSPGTRLFVQRFVQASMKENIKVLHYWPFNGNPQVTYGIHQWNTLTKGQKLGKDFHAAAWWLRFQSIASHGLALQEYCTLSTRTRWRLLLNDIFNCLWLRYTFEFQFTFQWSIFFRTQPTINQHWFRFRYSTWPGMSLTEPMMGQFPNIHTPPGFHELTQWSLLTHWVRDKMDANSQTIFSNAFSWMKMLEFRWKFHWSLSARAQLTIFQHWFR